MAWGEISAYKTEKRCKRGRMLDEGVEGVSTPVVAERILHRECGTRL
jgi:hypothetical protein